MRKKICLVCVIVSSLWLVLSALVAWGFITSDRVIMVIALLMGGSVVGIADFGKKICRWAATHVVLWKIIAISSGMVLSYVLILNLSRMVVIAELLILLALAYLFFIKKESKNISNDSGGIKTLEEQMNRCC